MNRSIVVRYGNKSFSAKTTKTQRSHLNALYRSNEGQLLILLDQSLEDFFINSSSHSLSTLLDYSQVSDTSTNSRHEASNVFCTFLSLCLSLETYDFLGLLIKHTSTFHQSLRCPKEVIARYVYERKPKKQGIGQGFYHLRKVLAS